MDLQSDHLELLIKRFQQQRPLRTGSLIITLFGDAIVPRGGTVWLGSLIELLAPMAATKHNELMAWVEVDGLVEILGDSGRLRQIITNLLGNAIKFTDEGGRIMVAVTREDAWIVIRVTDTGVGISPEDLPRLAQPFEQASSNDGRNLKGTGLGLALTKSFAEMHGGRLAIESTLGEGTTVSIFLPVSSPGDADAEPSIQETEAAE